MTISYTQGSGLSICVDMRHKVILLKGVFMSFQSEKSFKKVQNKIKTRSLAPILGKQFDQKQLTYFFLPNPGLFF